MEAPDRFRLIGPDRLRIQEGGGCLSLFGVPFLLAGVFLTLVGMGVVPMGNSERVPAWAWPLIVLMGLVFVGVGGSLVFGRRWTMLDKGRGTVLKQWRLLLLPMRQEERSLAAFGSVALHLVEGDSDTADSYPIVLKSRGGEADLNIYSSQFYGDSLKAAVFAARFLDFPLVDATSEHESVIGPAGLGETFRDRLRSRGETFGRAARPLEMRSQVTQSSMMTRIVIPGPGYRARRLLGLILPGAILYYAVPPLLDFFRRTHTPEFVQMFFLGFLILVLGVLPLLGSLRSMMLGRRARTTVTVDVEGLEIEERAVWRRKTTKVPAGEIFDIDYSTSRAALGSAKASAVRQARAKARDDWERRADAMSQSWWFEQLSRLAKSKGVIVKSHKGVFTFGAGLADDEVEYLHSVVKAALAGSAQRI